MNTDTPSQRAPRTFPPGNTQDGSGDAGPDAAAPGTWEGRPLDRPTDELVDQGLAFDIGTLVTRRRALGVLGAGTAAAILAACSGGQSSDNSGAGEMPDETAGPYPADGSNGPDVLASSGIERSDIRSSIDSDTTAEGVPMTLTMNIIDMAQGNAAMAGAAVYVWQADTQGYYSMYTGGLDEETYLRGVQVVGEDGTVSFTSIFPGCYPNRWPHIHFEVFPDIESITDAGNAILTSQIALSEEAGNAVYQRSEYEGSAENLAEVTLDTDIEFKDGWELQLATVTGDVDAGFAATIDVPIDTGTDPAPQRRLPPGWVIELVTGR